MIKKEAPNFSFIIDPDNSASKSEPRLDAKLCYSGSFLTRALFTNNISLLCFVKTPMVRMSSGMIKDRYTVKCT